MELNIFIFIGNTSRRLHRGVSILFVYIILLSDKSLVYIIINKIIIVNKMFTAVEAGGVASCDLVPPTEVGRRNKFKSNTSIVDGNELLLL